MVSYKPKFKRGNLMIYQSSTVQRKIINQTASPSTPRCESTQTTCSSNYSSSTDSTARVPFQEQAAAATYSQRSSSLSSAEGAAVGALCVAPVHETGAAGVSVRAAARCRLAAQSHRARRRPRAWASTQLAPQPPLVASPQCCLYPH